MTEHRRRVRNRHTPSALEGLDPFEKPHERLNQRTPHVTRCAWPGCRVPMQASVVPGRIIQDRYGVLCRVHALDVAVAVTQHDADLQRFQQFFSQQSSARAVRVEQWRREEERYEAEKAALRQDRDGFVYYIRIGERIKVGYSVDVKRRMRAYPPGSVLLAVEPGDRGIENQRHRQFAGSLLDGREWFRPTPDLIEHIEQVVAEHGDPRRHAHHYRRKTEPLRIKRSA